MNTKQPYCILTPLLISLKMNKYNKVTSSTPPNRKYEPAKNSIKTEGSEKSTQGNFTMPILFNKLLGHGQGTTMSGPEQQSQLANKRGSLSEEKSKQMRKTSIHRTESRPFTQNFIQDQLIDVSLPHPLKNLKPIKQYQVSQKRQFVQNTKEYLNSKSLSVKHDKNNRFFSKINEKNLARKGNMTIFSQRSESSRSQAGMQQKHLARMQQISRFFSEEKLYQRLCIYSKQTVKSSLRVYKEDLQKLIIHRYGKDRVTTFLDTQYIEDYNSVRKTTHEIFKFNQEQVLVLAFLIMDQNADGLITPGDLISFIGATNEKVLTNPLIMQDLYEIMRYLHKKHQRLESLLDSISYQYEQLTDQNLTLMKFRIFKFQKMKKANDKEGRSRRSKLITGPMLQRLFTLRQEKQDQRSISRKKVNNRINCVIQFILKGKKRKDNSQSDKVPIQFAINFQSFKQIFNQKIPRTFVDFLFLLAGVQIPRTIYIPIDSSVLIKNTTFKLEVEEEKGLSRFRTMLQNMKIFSEQSSNVYHTLINDSI